MITPTTVLILFAGLAQGTRETSQELSEREKNQQIDMVPPCKGTLVRLKNGFAGWRNDSYLRNGHLGSVQKDGLDENGDLRVIWENYREKVHPISPSAVDVYGFRVGNLLECKLTKDDGKTTVGWTDVEVMEEPKETDGLYKVKYLKSDQFKEFEGRSKNVFGRNFYSDIHNVEKAELRIPPHGAIILNKAAEALKNLNKTNVLKAEVIGLKRQLQYTKDAQLRCIQYKEGQRVSIFYRKDKKWYPGVIQYVVSQSRGSKYMISWDDKPNRNVLKCATCEIRPLCPRCHGSRSRPRAARRATGVFMLDPRRATGLCRDRFHWARRRLTHSTSPNFADLVQHIEEQGFTFRYD